MHGLRSIAFNEPVFPSRTAPRNNDVLQVDRVYPRQTAVEPAVAAGEAFWHRRAFWRRPNYRAAGTVAEEFKSLGGGRRGFAADDKMASAVGNVTRAEDIGAGLNLLDFTAIDE